MTKSIQKVQTIMQVVLLGLLIAVVLAQANPTFQAPNRDGGLFMYMGSQILKGKILYVDIWDNKGPLVFYLNALGLYLAHGLRWGVWGIEFVFLFFAALFGFDLMKRNWGMVSAIFGTLFWLTAFNNVARGGNFTEDYSLLFNFAALYIFWLNLNRGPKRIYQFLIGVTLSLSFLLRANNIGVQVSIIFVTLFSAFFDKDYRKRLTELMWIGAGSLCILAVAALFFQLSGNLDKMVVAGYTYNLFYSGDGAKISDLAESFFRGINLLGYISTIPALLGFLVLLEKLPGAIRSETRHPRDLYLLILVGWPFEIVLSDLSGRNYPHYYICWSPYIALLCGLLMYALIPAISEYLNKRSLMTLLTATALVIISQFGILVQYKVAFGRLFFKRDEGVELVTPVAKYIRENTNPADTVLVWGFQPYVNLMARRDSSTSILSYPVLIESPFSAELNDKFYQDLVENKPVFIVDMVNPDNDTIPFIDPLLRETQAQRLKRFKPPPNLDAVFEYILKNYHVEAQIDKVLIYKRNDLTP